MSACRAIPRENPGVSRHPTKNPGFSRHRTKIISASNNFTFFSGACVWRSIPKRPKMLGRKGNKINEKGGGRAAAQGKAQPSPIWANNKCGTMRTAKISRWLLVQVVFCCPFVFSFFLFLTATCASCFSLKEQFRKDQTSSNVWPKSDSRKCPITQHEPKWDRLAPTLALI